MTIKRITFLQELLDFMGLGGRLHLEWISSAEAQKFVQVVSDFTEKIRALGPNPLAGKTPAGKLWTPAEFSPNRQTKLLDNAIQVEEAAHESNSEAVA